MGLICDFSGTHTLGATPFNSCTSVWALSQAKAYKSMQKKLTNDFYKN